MRKRDEIAIRCADSFAQLSMIPRAAPYDIVELKFYTIQEKESANAKAMEDSLWFYSNISKLRPTSDLRGVLTNFMAASCRSGLSFAAKESICKNAENSFGQFSRSLISGRNFVSLATVVYNSKVLGTPWNI